MDQWGYQSTRADSYRPCQCCTVENESLDDCCCPPAMGGRWLSPARVQLKERALQGAYRDLWRQLLDCFGARRCHQYLNLATITLVNSGQVAGHRHEIGL